MSKAKITDVNKLVREYESGLSTVALGKLYGTSATVINKWLKRSGVTLRTLTEAHQLRDVAGENNPNFKGRGIYAEDGAYLCPDGNGYLRRIVKNHPLANEDGLIGEHVYQACLKYGVDAVRGKDVHHIDGDNQNNDWRNLIPLSRSKHRSYENNLEWTSGIRRRCA